MMKFRFQSFFDIKTSAESMQLIQWAVGGKEVLERCQHLFGAYKYFKLGKISVKLVPASTLPVDPLGLSYDAEDPQTIDPRDQMNPGLVRITNGEDIFTEISRLNPAQQEAVYNSMMLDPKWSKFMLQSGFRRSAYPLYWQIGQLQQDYWPGSVVNIPTDENSPYIGLTSVASEHNVPGVGFNVLCSDINKSSSRGLFQVGHRGKLGFLPTDAYQKVFTGTGGDQTDKYGFNNIPEVKVITCVLPKAYKTVYYYRCFITEEVIFTGLRSAPYQSDANLGYYMGLDNFAIGKATPVDVTSGITPVIHSDKMNNGSD